MVPDYRIRIFLSVDLVGSTAYKAGQGRADSNAQREAPRPQWLAETTKFYTWFSTKFLGRFNALSGLAEATPAFVPMVWKTIGDEIVFVMTIESVDTAAICVNAFLDTLFEYRNKLNATNIPLDVKGAGWTAAFPAPNTTLSLKKLSDETLLSAPQFEDQADKDPIGFDYLGTAIDCGFRVAKYAGAECMPLTVELAAILAEAAVRGLFSCGFVYKGRNNLKGVIGDRPYPVIYIDTERSTLRRLVNSREDALTGKHDIKPEAVMDFVLAFMDDENIEHPYFANDTRFTTPSTVYRTYYDRQIKVLEEIAQEDKAREASQLSESPSDGNEQEELPESVTTQLGIDLDLMEQIPVKMNNNG